MTGRIANGLRLIIRTSKGAIHGNFGSSDMATSSARILLAVDDRGARCASIEETQKSSFWRVRVKLSPSTWACRKVPKRVRKVPSGNFYSTRFADKTAFKSSNVVGLK